MNSVSRDRSTSSADGSHNSPPKATFTAPAYSAALSFRGRRSGGTGIRDRLKIDCPCGLVGSNPTSGIRGGLSRLRGAARGAGAVFLAGTDRPLLLDVP